MHHLRLLILVVNVFFNAFVFTQSNFCSYEEDFFEYIPKTVTVRRKLEKKTKSVWQYLNPKNLFSKGGEYETVEKTDLVLEKRRRIVTVCCRGFVKVGNECMISATNLESTSKATITDILPLISLATELSLSMVNVTKNESPLSLSSNSFSDTPNVNMSSSTSLADMLSVKSPIKNDEFVPTNLPKLVIPEVIKINQSLKNGIPILMFEEAKNNSKGLGITFFEVSNLTTKKEFNSSNLEGITLYDLLKTNESYNDETNNSATESNPVLVTTALKILNQPNSTNISISQFNNNKVTIIEMNPFSANKSAITKSSIFQTPSVQNTVDNSFNSAVSSDVFTTQITSMFQDAKVSFNTVTEVNTNIDNLITRTTFLENNEDFITVTSDTLASSLSETTSFILDDETIISYIMSSRIDMSTTISPMQRSNSDSTQYLISTPVILKSNYEDISPNAVFISKSSDTSILLQSTGNNLIEIEPPPTDVTYPSLPTTISKVILNDHIEQILIRNSTDNSNSTNFPIILSSLKAAKSFETIEIEPKGKILNNVTFNDINEMTIDTNQQKKKKNNLIETFIRAILKILLELLQYVLLL